VVVLAVVVEVAVAVAVLVVVALVAAPGAVDEHALAAMAAPTIATTIAGGRRRMRRD
jgi:hypothetical protein